MPIYKYEELSHADLTGLPRERTAIFIPVGPLEQHGPHLPLGTDAFHSHFFSVKMAERLAKTRPDWHFILFPTIYAGSDTQTYAGTIEIRPSVLRAYLYDCCKQLAKDGFRTLIAVGAHGGPRHMVVLEEVAAKLRWRHKARMISASSKILVDLLKGDFVQKIAARLEKSGSPLTDDEKRGLISDYHGGLLETSLILVSHPETVKPLYKTLKPALVKKLWHLTRKSGKTVGDGLGYLGSPAGARAEIGQAATDVILDDMAPLLERFLNGENVSRQFRSVFYYLPFFRTDFRIVLFLILYATVFVFGAYLLNRYLMEMFR